jgi:acyl-CoA hydrolase
MDAPLGVAERHREVLLEVGSLALDQGPAVFAAAPKVLSPNSLATLIRPGELVYLPGSSGAPLEFVADLIRQPECSRDLRMLTSYAPGINKLQIDSFDPTACVTGLFMQPGLTGAQRDRRYRTLPITYAGFVRHVLDNVDVDLTVIQVSPPNAAGRCSLGPAVEFTPVVMHKSRRVLGLVNRRTPYLPGATSIVYADLDYVCEVDTALPTYDTVPDSATASIARHIAPLVPDGSALQLGLGKVPLALSHLLRDRKGLRLHSGMLSDGMLDLAESGALDLNFRHTACVLLGTTDFYERVADFDPLRVVGCEVTHNPRTLLGIDGFVAVNSGLEVDLFGQCNLEHADGRAISGAGGAPDFARAARLSAGGRSIVALNATHHGGKGSRIVPCLTDRAVTSLSRVDVDFVVTEFGSAALSGRSVHERAEAIIEVAAPAFRPSLRDAWRDIAARL